MEETVIHVVALLICALIAVLEITVAGREPFHWIAVICGIIGIALPAPYTFFDERRKYIESDPVRSKRLSKYQDSAHSSRENYIPLKDITDAPPLKTVDPPSKSNSDKGEVSPIETDETDSVALAKKPKSVVKDIVKIGPSLGALLAVVVLAATDKSSGVSISGVKIQTMEIPQPIDYEIPYSPFNEKECIRGIYNESEYKLNNRTSMGLCFLNEQVYDYFVFIKHENKNPIFFSQKTWGYILVDAPYMNRLKRGCRYVLIHPMLEDHLHFKHCINESGNNHQVTSTNFWNDYANITLDTIAWSNFMGYLYDVALQGTRVNLLQDYCEHQLECTRLQHCPAMNIEYPLPPDAIEP